MTANLLQVGWLGVDEEFVDGRDLDVINQAQVDAHAYLGKVMHRSSLLIFLAVQRMPNARLTSSEDPVRFHEPRSLSPYARSQSDEGRYRKLV